MDFKETWCDGVDLIYLAQGKGKRQAVVNTVMNL
jgi:hypothetical protein